MVRVGRKSRPHKAIKVKNKNEKNIAKKMSVDNSLMLKSLYPNNKLAIIGGGWYGCSAAIAAAEQGISVTLYESENQLLAKSSKYNQNRLHQGLHYMRDKSTRTECLSGYKIFMKKYPSAARDVVRNLYAISINSFMDLGTVMSIAENEGIPCTDSKIDRFLRNTQGCLECSEKMINVSVARKLLTEELENLKVNVQLNRMVNDVDEILKTHDRVMFCTYNQHKNSLPGYIYEHCISFLYKKVGDIILPFESLTIIDGDFVSLYPIADETHGDCYTLTHVKHTPFNISDCPERCVPDDLHERRQAMEKTMLDYYDDFLLHFCCVGYNISVKTKSKHDKSSKRKHEIYTDGNMTHFFGGKITGALDGAHDAIFLNNARDLGDFKQSNFHKSLILYFPDVTIAKYLKTNYIDRRAPIVLSDDNFVLEYPSRQPTCGDIFLDATESVYDECFLLSSWYTAQNPGHNVSHLLFSYYFYEFACPTAKIILDLHAYRNCKITQDFIKFNNWSDRLYLINPGDCKRFNRLVVPPTTFDNLHKKYCLEHVNYFLQRVLLRKQNLNVREKIVLCKLAHHNYMVKKGILHPEAVKIFQSKGWYVIDVEEEAFTDIVWYLANCNQCLIGSGAVNYAHRRFVSKEAKLGFLFNTNRNYHFDMENRPLYCAYLNEIDGCHEINVHKCINIFENKPKYKGCSAESTFEIFRIKHQNKFFPEFLRYADRTHLNNKCSGEENEEHTLLKYLSKDVVKEVIKCRKHNKKLNAFNKIILVKAEQVLMNIVKYECDFIYLELFDDTNYAVEEESMNKSVVTRLQKNNFFALHKIGAYILFKKITT